MSFLRLAAALLGLLAVPALAQTPSPVPAAPRSVPAPTAPAAPTVPRPAPAVAPAPAPAAGKRVDINAATAAQLQVLPGIGPVRAAAIVAGRPYASPQDLVTKKVLTQGVLDGMKDLITYKSLS